MTGGLMKTTSQLAIAAAASMILGGVTLTSAKAADLGGDCCADLEERVAELEANTARKGNNKVSLTISGSVAFALTAWDDGFAQDTNIENPDTYGNGINFEGSGKIHGDLSAGYAIRMDWRRGNPFDATSQTDANNKAAIDDGDADSNGLGSIQDYNNRASNVSVSQQFVYLDSKSAGRLSMGYRNSAYKSYNDGAFDLAGIDYMSAPAGRQAGISFRDSVTGVGTGKDLYSVSGNLGSDKDNIIRYDSPTLAGFSLSASWGGDDQGAIGVSYNGKFSDVEFVGGVAYEQDTRNRDNSRELFLVAGSLYHSSSGLFITGEYNHRELTDVSDPDANTWVVKGGWRKNVSGLGDSIVYASYLRGNDVTADVEAGTWTVAFGQNIDSAATQLFLTYDHSEILSGDEVLGCSNGCGDINVFSAGMKIAF